MTLFDRTFRKRPFTSGGVLFGASMFIVTLFKSLIGGQALTTHLIAFEAMGWIAGGVLFGGAMAICMFAIRLRPGRGGKPDAR